MYQTMPPDREVGCKPVDDSHSMTMQNQSLQEESNFWDSSGPLFSIYSKAAEEEDKKMVERWQKDADGILIFTGLFSAAVAVLLALAVQDLRQTSQDTSAFYLGIIYQALVDPNVTRPSISSPVTIPPKFTPPRYAVWVNSLWFLSLVVGLSCALLATSLHQWASRYLRLAQPVRCTPEKRARMRYFFANGVEKMYVPLAVEVLPALLHLSLFLFFGGLAIFLYNIDYEVFIPVVSWLMLLSIVYGLITFLPIIRHDSPYNSPLSTHAWLLYAGMKYVAFKCLSFITFHRSWSVQTWVHFTDLRNRYRRWMLGGVAKAAEETVSERSSEIDIQILDWTISALGDDDSLKSFFEAIPGFFNSKSLKIFERDYFPKKLLGDTLNGFLRRTWSSNSVNDSEKLRRLDIALNAMSLMPHSCPSVILWSILHEHWDQVPQTVAMGQTLARWCTSGDQPVTQYLKIIVARILVSARERDNSWVTLAARVFGLSEQDLLDNVALGGDSVLLAILIPVTRQYLRSHYDYRTRLVLEALSKLDIRNTHPRRQHDFCTLWNEVVQVVQESKNQGPYKPLVEILCGNRHLYIALHQGTDAAPTAFSASTHMNHPILRQPLAYPFCNIASHRPHSIDSRPPPGNSPDTWPRSPTYGSRIASRQAEQVDNVMKPPSSSNPTSTGETREISHGPDMTPLTNPVHSRSRPTGAPPTPAVADAPQEITWTATLSHPRNGNEEQDTDMVAPSAEPGTSQILSTASSTPTLMPIPTSLPNTLSESYDAGVISGPHSSHLASPSFGSSIPASRPTSSAALPRLRARGIVNTRNTCFASAVLQLLVNSPPFWNLFRELDDLKGQRGAGVPEAGGGATPLVDATLRFFKEFIADVSPSTQRQSQPATGGTLRADEEKKDDNVFDSFEPTYMYDAMKENRQLKPLLDGQQQDAEEFLCLYLEALDEELLPLLASISGRQSATCTFTGTRLSFSPFPTSALGPMSHTQGGQGFMANFVESPTRRIFGGKFRSAVRTPNQPDLVPTEDWRSLRLDIQPDSIRTVQGALAHISHLPSVQVSASGLGNTSLIEALPPVLVLHLNRVRYDASTGGIMKIGKSIQIAPELEIPLDIMVPNSQRPSEPPHYKLYGVLYHHGESAGGGHYTVDVLHPNGDGDIGEVWLHIDDEAVSPMRHEDVFGDGTKRAADERCAYLLFYCHASPIGTS